MPDQREQPQRTPCNPKQPRSRCRRSGALVNAGEVIVSPGLTCVDPVFLGRIWGRLGHSTVTTHRRLCTAALMCGMMVFVTGTPDDIKVTPQVRDVVDVLAKSTTPIHGWEIARRAGQEPATVYRILARLRDRLWVTAQWADEEDQVGVRRRLYQMTETGKARAAVLLASARTKQEEQQ